MRKLVTRVLLGAAVLGLAASLPLSQAQARLSRAQHQHHRAVLARRRL